MSLELSIISTLISFWKFLIGFLSGFLFEIIRKSDPFTDPFILEVFISNQQHQDAPIGFKVRNTTQHSLKTDIEITPIVHDEKYGTIPYNIVLNPNEEYIEERISGDYRYIRFINDMHKLNDDSYKNNKQPLKFELQANFSDSRLKVFKIHNSTKIKTAFDNTTKTFRRVE